MPRDVRDLRHHDAMPASPAEPRMPGHARGVVRTAAALALAAWSAAASASAMPDTLRVCVDPDNLPDSQRDVRSFEPAMAALLADTLNMPLELRWRPQRRGVVRKNNSAGCDVRLGVPLRPEGLALRQPYPVVQARGWRIGAAPGP
jgi:mxaJ protein